MRYELKLRIETEAGISGLHRLRHVLKEMLRKHGIVCVDAREVPSELEDDFGP